MYQKIILGLLLIGLTAGVHAATDLSFIDIDELGHEKLQQLKTHQRVDWWLEMGDKMVVSLNDKPEDLPAFARVIASHKQVNLSDLAFERSGHCAHGDPEDHDHQAKLNAVKQPHPDFEVIFSSGDFSATSSVVASSLSNSVSSRICSIVFLASRSISASSSSKYSCAPARPTVSSNSLTGASSVITYLHG